MDDSNDLAGPEAGRSIKHGEEYNHAQHGRVEVSGIWRGINEVDSTRNTDQKEVIIIRYSAEQENERAVELTDTLDKFLQAIE